MHNKLKKNVFLTVNLRIIKKRDKFNAIIVNNKPNGNKRVNRENYYSGKH